MMMRRVALTGVVTVSVLALSGCLVEATEPLTPSDLEYESTGNEFKFGETVYYIPYSRDEPSPITITVEAPVAFTPTDAASAWDDQSSVAREGELYEDSIYFEVTITNRSDAVVYEPDFFFTHAHPANGDDPASSVSDEGVEGFSRAPLEAGESITFRDGFSVPNADGVTYEIDIDGTKGQSFYFSD